MVGAAGELGNVLGSTGGCGRVETSLSDSQVGGVQVQELDQRNPKPKVMVADSLYGNHLFLAIFLMVKNAFALVRLRSNLVF